MVFGLDIQFRLKGKQTNLYLNQWNSIWFKIERKTVTMIISHSMWKEMKILFFQCMWDSIKVPPSAPQYNIVDVFNGFQDMLLHCSLWCREALASHRYVEWHMLTKINFPFLSSWIDYDRGDSFSIRLWTKYTPIKVRMSNRH